MTSGANELDELRNGIDACDDAILNAFLRRMSIVKEVAGYKRRLNMPVQDASREENVIRRLTAGLDPETSEYVKRLFGTLFEISRSYQDTRIGG